jgi:diguanylate cyclase (GGDEF)-like protein/PAS domain S-box-containing protein
MTSNPPPPSVDPQGARGEAEVLELFRTAVGEIPGATVLVFDTDLRYRAARGGALGRHGFDHHAIEDHMVIDVLGAERWPLYEDAYRGALEGRTSRIDEVPSPDGSAWFDVRVAPLRAGDGLIVGGVSIAVDVTERVARERQLAVSEERWRRTMRDAPIAMAVVSPEGAWLDVNPAMCELFGLSSEELLTKTWQDLTHPDDMAGNLRAVADMLAGRTDGIRHRKRYLHADGHVLSVELAVTPIRDDEGQSVFQIAQMVDVTEQVRVEAELRRSESELRTILDAAPDAVFRLDADRRITYLNAPVREAVGPVADGWIGKHYEEVTAGGDAETWNGKVAEVYVTGEPVTFDVNARPEYGDGWWDVRLIPTADDEGTVSDVIVIMRDITEHKQAELALRDAATHDPLTGLANRAELFSEIERALSSSSRSGSSIGVMMLDLDRFKGVNDSLGHATGDGLLLAAARRIQATIRAGDMAGRLGGDEFVVVMRDLTDPTEAARVAGRLVAAFREPMAVGDLALVTTTSIGLTIAEPGAHTDPARLLDEADTALYTAKSSGRDRLAYFDDDLRTVVDERQRTEVELRLALDRGQLELWFQPEIDLATGRVRAAEALLRWRHPSGELMAAERFIHVAEESGLIGDIGDWAIREACRQAASWAASRPEDPPVVRVNLSLAQLGDVDLFATVKAALHAAGLPPRLLCVEVDEATLLRKATGTAEVLTELRGLGVLVAVDAFGSGDTPLSYLRDFPVDVLKLDRSFVTTLVDDDGDRRLVAGILALAGELELPVTAKSVETDDQVEALRRLGCETAQGWVFWPAIEPARITSLLHAERVR